MQELNYLKDKVITPGAAPFVSHATYPVNDGHADLWLYDIFPGVQLMVTDFACETCFQDGMEQDVIGIHHCARGRFECVFDHWNYVYIVVLEDGHVAQQGAPAELMEQGGLYRRMVELQRESARWRLNGAEA